MPRKKDKRKKASRTVHFATTTQTISFNKGQRPNAIQETQPTQSPAALGSPKREQSPVSEASNQPNEKSFTTKQEDETSNMATTAPQTPKTSENKQLKHDLASARKDLELSKLENSHLRQSKQWAITGCRLAFRNCREKGTLLEHALGDLKKALHDNKDLKIDLETAAGELMETFRDNNNLRKLLKLQLRQRRRFGANKQSLAEGLRRWRLRRWRERRQGDTE